MGLVEDLVEHATPKGVVLSVVGLFVGYIALRFIQILLENFKISRRGPRAYKVPYTFPLGEQAVFPPGTGIDAV